MQSSRPHQRRVVAADSVWVNQFTTPCDVFSEGFNSKSVQLLSAFIRYDCITDEVTELKLAQTSSTLVDPKEFGDDWSEQLTAGEGGRDSAPHAGGRQIRRQRPRL